MIFWFFGGKIYIYIYIYILITSYHHLLLITFHFGNYEKCCGSRVIDISIVMFEGENGQMRF